MSTPLVIAAADVRPGDRIWNAGAFHPSARWVRVVSVERDIGTVRLEGGSLKQVDGVTIHTTDWQTWKMLVEGIAVLRDEATP